MPCQLPLRGVVQLPRTRVCPSARTDSNNAAAYMQYVSVWDCLLVGITFTISWLIVMACMLSTPTITRLPRRASSSASVQYWLNWEVAKTTISPFRSYS